MTDRPVPTIDPRGAARAAEGDALLLDVREHDEWQDAHVEGSLHLPFHELRDGVPSELRKRAAQKPLAVACSAGNRSSLAVSLLRRHGVHEVQHVATVCTRCSTSPEAASTT